MVSLSNHRQVSPRAVGVEVESGGEVFTVEGEEIVLCAGGLASPQLLLLSGSRTVEQHLRDMGIPVILDSPGVGHGTCATIPWCWLTWSPVREWRCRKTCRESRPGLRYTAEGSDVRSDMQITLTSYAGVGGGDPIAGASRSRNGKTLHFTVILELAESAGELTLASTDPSDGPNIDYRYLEDEFDVRRLREAIRLCSRLTEHESFRPLVHGLATPAEADLATDDALDAWLHENVSTTFHTCGSARMGPDGDADGGGGPALPRSRRRGTAGGGPVGRAQRGAGQHERDGDHDRGAGGGVVLRVDTGLGTQDSQRQWSPALA